MMKIIYIYFFDDKLPEIRCPMECQVIGVMVIPGSARFIIMSGS